MNHKTWWAIEGCARKWKDRETLSRQGWVAALKNNRQSKVRNRPDGAMKKFFIIEKSRKNIDKLFRPEKHGWVIFTCVSESEIYSLARSLEIRYPDGKIVVIMGKNPVWEPLFKRNCGCEILNPVYPIKAKSLFYRQMKNLMG